MPGLSRTESLLVADAVYKHHERPDGKGYYSIPASRIPPEADIIRTADTIDAMQEDRPYKAPSSMDQIMDVLKHPINQHNLHLTDAADRMRRISGVFMRPKT